LNLSRKTFLRSSSGACLCLPLLDATSDETLTNNLPMRFVGVGAYYGFVPSNFFPTKAGHDYKIPLLLEPLKSHRQDFSLFSNLDHGSGGQGGHLGVHTYLSGIKSTMAKGFSEGNISVDQKFVQMNDLKTRYNSLVLSTQSDKLSYISWAKTGVPILPETRVKSLFEKLLIEPNPSAKKKLANMYVRKKSILDGLKDSVKLMETRISTHDKQKLDLYFSTVRSVEKKVFQNETYLDQPKPKFNYTLPKQTSWEDNMKAFYDLIAIALQTDQTRSITYSITDMIANHGVKGVNKGYHTLTHHGQVSDYLKGLTAIELTITKCFDYFLNKLKEVEESNGKRLFDNTMVLFGSGMGNASSHTNKRLPILLTGGGFEHGEHKVYEKDKVPLNNLYLSMLQRLGLPIDKFNTSTGTLPGLVSA